MKTIKLWSGLYGSGKSTHLIEEFKKHYRNECIFIVMDGFKTIFRDHHGIETISFSDVAKRKNLILNRKIFIDDADVFMTIDGFYPILEILCNYNQIFMTATNSEFYKVQDLGNDLTSALFLENIQGVERKRLFLNDNPWIPEDYAKMIEKKTGYKE